MLEPVAVEWPCAELTVFRLRRWALRRLIIRPIAGLLDRQEGLRELPSGPFVVNVTIDTRLRSFRRVESGQAVHGFSVPVTGLDQARFVREHDELDPVAQPRLLKDVRDICFTVPAVTTSLSASAARTARR